MQRIKPTYLGIKKMNLNTPAGQPTFIININDHSHTKTDFRHKMKLFICTNQIPDFKTIRFDFHIPMFLQIHQHIVDRMAHQNQRNILFRHLDGDSRYRIHLSRTLYLAHQTMSAHFAVPKW